MRDTRIEVVGDAVILSWEKFPTTIAPDHRTPEDYMYADGPLLVDGVTSEEWAPVAAVGDKLKVENVHTGEERVVPMRDVRFVHEG